MTVAVFPVYSLCIDQWSEQIESVQKGLIKTPDNYHDLPQYCVMVVQPKDNIYIRVVEHNVPQYKQCGFMVSKGAFGIRMGHQTSCKLQSSGWLLYSGSDVTLNFTIYNLNHLVPFWIEYRCKYTRQILVVYELVRRIIYKSDTSPTSEKYGSTPSLHPKFWCYISGSKGDSSGPTFWGPMIDTIILVSFSGSNPDMWFKHEPEPFDTIRPWGHSYLDLFFKKTMCIYIHVFILTVLPFSSL